MSTRFAKYLQEFFTVRLMKERDASLETVTSYRDAFRLLLAFLETKLGKAPAKIELEDLDAPIITKFLQYLEDVRGNCARTRNARLAAIHSFFRYVSFKEPQLLDQIQRILAIPSKRWEKKLIDFLTRDEAEAIVDAIDPQTLAGQRDRALFMLMAQTGLRVSETIQLRFEDVVLGEASHVRCQGKGRKERCVPLRKALAKTLGEWLELRGAQPSDRLFTNAKGAPLSRDGVAYLLKKHVAVACQKCPSLLGKRVTPHVLRHTLAMDLLHHGVDRSTIALWLGHASVETTQCYIHADLQLKQKALEKTQPWGSSPRRYQPPDDVLAFLEGLVMPSGRGPEICNPATMGGSG